MIKAANVIAYIQGPLDGICQYFEPSVQAQCSSLMAGRTAAGVSLENFSFGSPSTSSSLPPQTPAIPDTFGLDGLRD